MITIFILIIYPIINFVIIYFKMKSKFLNFKINKLKLINKNPNL